MGGKLTAETHLLCNISQDRIANTSNADDEEEEEEEKIPSEARTGNPALACLHAYMPHLCLSLSFRLAYQ